MTNRDQNSLVRLRGFVFRISGWSRSQLAISAFKLAISSGSVKSSDPICLSIQNVGFGSLSTDPAGFACGSMSAFPRKRLRHSPQDRAPGCVLEPSAIEGLSINTIAGHLAKFKCAAQRHLPPTDALPKIFPRGICHLRIAEIAPQPRPER